MANDTPVRQVPKGKVYIQSSFNNTIVTATDEKGNVLAWETAGTSGFSGSRKSTPYAAQVATKKLIEKMKNHGLREVALYVSGVGVGRDSAIRSFAGSGISVSMIADTTPVPHNGARPKKPRRV
jgi:small subunit ribosomal protein S11